MMDQTHLGYTYWQEPPRNAMPKVERITLPGACGDGRVGGGRSADVPGPVHTLPAFDRAGGQRYGIDVFNRGSVPFTFSARASEPWVSVTPTSGTVAAQQQLAVAIDWSRVPRGRQNASISIVGSDGARAEVQATVFNEEMPIAGRFNGFIESGGVVSMEAEHFTSAVGRGGIRLAAHPLASVARCRA